MLTRKLIKNLSYKIVGCGIVVHRNLGPGLLESVYESCLIEELLTNHLNVKSQILLPVNYKGKELGSALRIDLLVEDLIIVELKSVEAMIPLYKAQLLTYLKLTKMPKGLLINFNCVIITDQLIPLVTEEFAKLPKE